MISSKSGQAHEMSHQGHEGRPSGWRSKAVVVGIGALGALLMGGGVFAAWVPTSNISSGSYAAADLNVTMVDTNGTVFSAGVSNLLPGDFLNRYVNITNNGTVPQIFSGTSNGSGVLGSAMTVKIDSCSVAWNASGACTGTTTPVLAATVTNPAASFTFPSLAVSGVQRVRFQYKVDPAAAPSFAGTATTQVVTITGNAATAGGADRTAG